LNLFRWAEGWVVLFDRTTYSACCFSDDLEILQDCKDEHAIMIEVDTEFPGSKLESFGRCVSHVLESDDVSLVHE